MEKENHAHGIKVLMSRRNKSPCLKRHPIIVGLMWPVNNITFNKKWLKQWQFIFSPLSPEAGISRTSSLSSTTSRSKTLLCTRSYSPVDLSPYSCRWLNSSRHHISLSLSPQTKSELSQVSPFYQEEKTFKGPLQPTSSTSLTSIGYMLCPKQIPAEGEWDSSPQKEKGPSYYPRARNRIRYVRCLRYKI